MFVYIYIHRYSIFTRYEEFTIYSQRTIEVHYVWQEQHIACASVVDSWKIYAYVFNHKKIEQKKNIEKKEKKNDD